MRRAICGSAIAASALLAGMVTLPSSAASTAAGRHHHQGHVRLMVVPANPKVGQSVRLYVTGVLRGGRHYVVEAGNLGDSAFIADFGCPLDSPQRQMYREPFTVHYRHAWSKPGTYKVSLTIGAPCSNPGLPERRGRAMVTVSAEQ